jgi:glycine/D-amino acid oxidase-like deaminating enzyme
VLMGAISQKVKGKAWRLRETSLHRYETLIPELEAAIDQPIPFNRQGILLLCNEPSALPKWESLVELRRQQGWHLEIWQPEIIRDRCPQIDCSNWVAGIYSSGDRQVDPTALTLALVKAAEQNGVSFYLNEPVKQLQCQSQAGIQTCEAVETTAQTLTIDWIVISAGLGSTQLTQMATEPIAIKPVLGQAVQVKFAQPLGDSAFQPVITGNDIHLVPLGQGEYWVGATVEFPAETGEVIADEAAWQTVWNGAIALCPALAEAQILKTWSGLRPRPDNRPAPIIEPLAGYRNVLLATGHYRNGVLLAPATAIAIRDAIVNAS